MNKISVICCIVLLLITDLKAQNVGIGTIFPSYKLDVRTTENGTALGLRTLKDSIGASTLLRFTTGLNLLLPDDRSSYLGNIRSGSGSNIIFGTASSGNDAIERMRLNALGNLGIGTINPIAKLHLDLTTTSNTNAILINDEDDPMIQFQRLDIDKGFVQVVGDDFRLGTNANNDLGKLIFRVNGTSRIFITPTGRFGYGIADPVGMFQITGGSDAGATSNGFLMLGDEAGENVVFDNNEILARNNGVVSTLFLARDGSKLQLGNGTETSGTKLHISTGNEVGLTDPNSGFLLIGSIGGNNIAVDNNEIQARNNGSAANLFLQNSGGNVRIGDGPFTSTHKLGVAGDVVVTGGMRIGNTISPAGFKFAVDGKIICTEVLVKLVAGWPDYVFNKNYKLKQLDQLEQFIQKNKHLPGIPSAREIEKSGVSLGKMQRLQMEKIEELTLYIIELKKEIEKLKQQR